MRGQKQTYPVKLSESEVEQLRDVMQRGEHTRRERQRAQMLLWSAAGKTDLEIAELVSVTPLTVATTRERWVKEKRLADTPKAGRRKKLDGKQEALLVALACSDAPEGRESWTLQLLADRLMELQVVDDPVSYETGADDTEKNELKPWQKEQWCIPTVSADFVWRMEDVLELYAEPYQGRQPVVCFDERPCVLHGDTRPAVPAQPGRVARYDYEYQRNGHCNLFMLFQPAAGWRHTKVTEQRKKSDFAECMRELVDVHFPDAEKIQVVMDNLNTHTPASLYAVFPPAEARRILSKLEFHFTPKHASWLNMVEIELSVLVHQCLKRRIPDIDTLSRETTAWQMTRNAHHATVRWQFDVSQARTKLTRLYPELSS